MPHQGHDTITRAQRQRDDALARVARARRATIVGAGGLTVGLAAFVSAIAPGHSLGAKTSTRLTAEARSTSSRPGRSSSTGSALRMPSLASPSQLGLQGPGAAPQSAPPSAPAPQSQPAPVQQSAPVQPAPVSGGS